MKFSNYETGMNDSLFYKEVNRSMTEEAREMVVENLKMHSLSKLHKSGRNFYFLPCLSNFKFLGP